MLKKVTVAIALTGLMAGAAYAGTVAGTGINGSKHDMNVNYTDDVYARTCVFCHTPHNASATAQGPLWNRSVVTTGPAYTWQTPSNTTITASAATSTTLAGPTRLCQSCHDGNIAVDSHGTVGATAGTGAAKLTGNTKVDLAITHPIGIDYTVAITNRPGELRAVTQGFVTNPTAVAGAGFNTKAVLAGSATKTIGSVLYGGNIMTCASCHEVHNTNNYVTAATGAGAYNYFLNAPEEGSAICLSCHVK